jgi:tRNA nucleotidyltransferase (CCA-adding enzyme)
LAKAEEICSAVARRITPANTERRRVHALAQSLCATLTAECARQKLEAEVRLDGSVAKDTWLRREADIDIFLRVPTSLSRDELETRCLRTAKRALKGHPIIERFAEHPYVETYVDGVRVNVVPCYRVLQGEWRSATDRTPFHTDYVLSHLSPEQRNEVRLLKAFLKGIGAYGADVKVSGFSGMLCETLIMHYGSFIKALEEASSWKPRTTIDLERYYAGREKELPDLFEEQLVIIDPVDRGRNLAASISAKRLWEFVAAARAFSERPTRNYFAGRAVAALGPTQFRREMQRRNWNLMAIQFGKVDAVVDILWSQLYKTEKAVSSLLKQEGYLVMRSGSWSNEKDLNLIIYELESLTLPPVKKHLGPHVSRVEASRLFLQKHLKMNRNVSGPWIDSDRWAVVQLRDSVSVSELLRSRIRHGGRRIGVASRVAVAMRRKFSVLTETSLFEFYRENAEAAQFIASFLAGRPRWLDA